MLDWFLDIDNLTFLMAALGFIYSIYDFIATRIKSKESYNVAVIDYAERWSNTLQFLICITNKSSEPLSIADISVFETSCELKPKAIYGNPEKWNFQHTPDFPLCIDSHGCSYAYLEFVGEGLGHKQLGPGTAVSFEIHSTRKLVRKTVTLGPRSHYLHSREQSPAPQSQPPKKDVCSSR